MPTLSTNTRRSVRQDLLRYLDVGKTGTATSTGADSKELVDTSRIVSEDFWQDGQVHVTSGTREGETATVMSNEMEGGEIHLFPALAGTIASGSKYEIYHRSGWAKEDFDLAIKEALIWSRRRLLITRTDESLSMVASQYVYDLPQLEIKTASATSGSTTTIVDTSNLTQDDDYWNGDIVIITADSGQAANVGEVRFVKDFDAATDKITVDHAFPAVTSSNTTYRLIKYPFAYISDVLYYSSTSEWLHLPGRRDAWDIVPGLYPRLLLKQGALDAGKALMIMGQRYPGDVNVDLDLIEIPQNVIRPYAENYLREIRARGGRGVDPGDDRARGREAREEGEIELEQQAQLADPGSKFIG